MKASSSQQQIELGNNESDKLLLLDVMRDQDQDDDIFDKAFSSLWPKTDMALFEQILNDHPHVINANYGTCQESLLHRYLF